MSAAVHGKHVLKIDILRAGPDSGDFHISFDYDKTLVEAVRQIPGRQWYPLMKLWRAPSSSAPALKLLIQKMPAGSVELSAAAQERLQNVTASDQVPAPQLSVILDEPCLRLQFPYNASLVEAVKELPGALFSRPARQWLVPVSSAEPLSRLLERLPSSSVIYSPGAQERIRQITVQRRESIAASYSQDSTLQLPVPAGLTYLPYQKAGIAFALAHPNVLIGDDMGLGKTIQAIGMVNCDESLQRVCVICPASIKANWKREITKWSVRQGLPIIASGSPEHWMRSWEDLFGGYYRGLNGQLREGVQWLILNYQIVGRWEGLLRAAALDALIVDEAHYLKNPNAQRTRLILGTQQQAHEEASEPIAARRFIALTGTPIPNRPFECYPLLKRLAPEEFRSASQFVRRYCPNGKNRDGGSNLDELRERMRASCMVRRKKEHVLRQLPPKRRQVIEIAHDTPAVAAELAAWEAYQGQLIKLRAAAELAKASENPDEHKQAVQRLREGVSAAFQELSKVRHAVALAKVPLVITHLKDCLEDGRKLLCFAWHNDVIAKIAAAFPDCSVLITGQTPVEERQSIVDRFQSQPAVRLAVLNIRAAGVGLTLTAASHEVFAELVWTPGDLTQAEDRAHRIGQLSSVLIQHLVLEGSLDAVMARRIIDKQAIIDLALDTASTNPTDDEPLAPIPFEPATASLTREQLHTAAQRLQAARRITLKEKDADSGEEVQVEITMDDAQIQAIHECLRVLASQCDGAHEKDQMGFNALDTGIGRSLAWQGSLTLPQALLARKIIAKYRRQLPCVVLARALGKKLSQGAAAAAHSTQARR